MATEVLDNPDRRRFEIAVDGDIVGFAEYHSVDGVVTIPHTEIRPELNGRGLGSQLVRGTLDAIRAAGAHVAPACPFVRDYIAGHSDEYLDLVPADRRAAFSLPDRRPPAR